MSELRKGTQLAGRYTLKRALGSGGEGQTWLASDRMTGAAVVLKIAAPGAAATERLRQEWQLSIRLMHAHIVRVFEFHDDGPAALFSRQYIDGPEISVLAQAPLEHILPALAAIADALRYAHAKDVVHRDIKAANVLLDANGAPYLIDFGIADVAGGGGEGTSLIAASPQQLAGHAPQPADDIFALGGLLYELVSGRSPWSPATPTDDIRNASPAPLQGADGLPVPPWLQALVSSMLNKEASQRPSAKSVVAEFAAAGFAAGAAPRQYLSSSRAIDDEVIAASTTISAHKPATVAAATTTTQSEAGGLSPRTVGIAAAGLILLLLGVVFLLPSAVEETANDTAEQTAVESDERVAAAGTESRDDGVGFSENLDEYRGSDDRLKAREDAETALGELLSKMDTLEQRAVQRWGGSRYEQGKAAYEAGDAAYLDKDYVTARDKYLEAGQILEPLLNEVDGVFSRTVSAAEAAFAAGETAEAVTLFELAVAISPNNAEVRASYERALNLETVLSLVRQGKEFEKNLELEAALQSFGKAAELDAAWQPALDGVQRVEESIKQREFEQRMTEGLLALEEADYPAARAAFTMAKALKPQSREPADGLMQVDQGLKLGGITALEQQVYEQQQSEQWQAAADTYERILEIDPNLQFAQDGLREARKMVALHKQLADYIDEPDVLSNPTTMNIATKVVVDVTLMPDIGPRLRAQRDELSRLLKRAATPLTVTLQSDNATSVSIYRIGKLGSFDSHQLSLRPGTYVAVGSRPGYRDVRLEFQVAPEIDMQPIVVRCEEAI
ncbi:MAG: serine/threonine-protein kinase [Woeseiaceae bacterium]